VSAFELFGLVAMTVGPFAALYTLDWMEKKSAAAIAKRLRAGRNVRFNK
jgi:hypothetical protein